jgi:hypothetical protein
MGENSANLVTLMAAHMQSHSLGRLSRRSLAAFLNNNSLSLLLSAPPPTIEILAP